MAKASVVLPVSCHLCHFIRVRSFLPPHMSFHWCCIARAMSPVVPPRSCLLCHIFYALPHVLCYLSHVTCAKSPVPRHLSGVTSTMSLLPFHQLTCWCHVDHAMSNTQLLVPFCLCHVTCTSPFPFRPCHVTCHAIDLYSVTCAMPPAAAPDIQIAIPSIQCGLYYLTCAL